MAKIKLPKNPLSVVFILNKGKKILSRFLSSQADPAREN